MWPKWHWVSPAQTPIIRLSIQQHVPANNQENIKALYYWPFERRNPPASQRASTTGDRWIPLTKGQQWGNRFHVMTSYFFSLQPILLCSVLLLCLSSARGLNNREAQDLSRVISFQLWRQGPLPRTLNDPVLKLLRRLDWQAQYRWVPNEHTA